MSKKYLWSSLSTMTLLILTLSRMTLSKASFSDIHRNDYLDHFDTFFENFDFDTFKNDTFESVWVDRHPLSCFKPIFWLIPDMYLPKNAILCTWSITNNYYLFIFDTVWIFHGERAAQQATMTFLTTYSAHNLPTWYK